MLFSINLSKKEYIRSKVIGDEEIVDLLSGTFSPPTEYRADIVEVEEGYAGRSDLISAEVYGDESYSDILTKLNGPSDPFSIGDTNNYIILPGFDDIDSFTQSPARAWSETATSKQRPTRIKARSEKRKPNEAVIGDKRFNIDKTSKVVIY